MPVDPVPPKISRDLHRALHWDETVTPCRAQHAESGCATDWLHPENIKAVRRAISACHTCPLLAACAAHARITRPQGVVQAGAWWMANHRTPNPSPGPVGWRAAETA